MNIKEFREVIMQRAQIEDESNGENQNGIDSCWEKEIEILSEDIPSSIEFIRNECTADEFSWISEVIDDVVSRTKSVEFLHCYKEAMDRFPEECRRYNILQSVHAAESVFMKAGQNAEEESC